MLARIPRTSETLGDVQYRYMRGHSEDRDLLTGRELGVDLLPLSELSRMRQLLHKR